MLLKRIARQLLFEIDWAWDWRRRALTGRGVGMFPLVFATKNIVDYLSLQLCPRGHLRERVPGQCYISLANS